MRFFQQVVKTKLVIVLVGVALVSASCRSDDSVDAGADGGVDDVVIVATTNILGDVAEQLLGDQVEVVTIMPVGADPHDFQPSAQEVDTLLNASAVIANGEDFEEGLIDVLKSAVDAGRPVYEATDAVETIEFSEGGHDEHGDEHGDEDEHDEDEHDEDEHGDEHGHDGDDPHFFTDPARMADAVEGIVAFLSGVDGVDASALQAAGDDYVAQLNELDAEVEELVSAIPEDRRIMVTNHEVFGYFADRYGFEVVGAVVPSGSTADGASAGELAELAEVIEAEGVPAIFADTSASNALAETLAAEVGDVSVVELYSESLGDADSDGATYLEMVRANANRIAEALG